MASRLQAAGGAVLALLALCACAARASVSQCPAFAGAKAACGADTCGRYVFRGKFELAPAKPFRVPEAPNGLRLGAKAAPGDCCQQCRAHQSCVFWNFFASTGACYLYGAGLCDAPASQQVSSKASPFVANVAGSYVGGRCHDASQETSAAAEAAGLAPVKFPFLQERSFCLLSDPELHINMQLGGYLDQRTAINGQPAKARVWIREIGIMWASPKGERHSLHFSARRTPEQGRGDGFLKEIVVDGAAVPTMMLGDEVNLFDGQASILFDAYEKSGPVDMDKFSLRIQDVLEADVYVRPAHPLLQHQDDTMVHMNLDIQEVHHSTQVHGVLGQSYRKTEETEESNLDYNVLSQLITGTPQGSKVPFSLEGKAEDYWSTAVLKADCKFAQFLKPKAVALVTPKGGESNPKEYGADAEMAALVKEAQETAVTGQRTSTLAQDPAGTAAGEQTATVAQEAAGIAQEASGTVQKAAVKAEDKASKPATSKTLISSSR